MICQIKIHRRLLLKMRTESIVEVIRKCVQWEIEFDQVVLANRTGMFQNIVQLKQGRIVHNRLNLLARLRDMFLHDFRL